MQQVWINIIVACFLLYEGIQDLFTKKITLLPGIPILIVGIAYNYIYKVDTCFWLWSVGFSVVVFSLSYISRGQIGSGDGLILLILSPILGKRVISIFLLALFMCAIVGILLLLVNGITRKARLPLVPFMAVAYFLENLLGVSSK